MPCDDAVRSEPTLSLCSLEQLWRTWPSQGRCRCGWAFHAVIRLVAGSYLAREPCRKPLGEILSSSIFEMMIGFVAMLERKQRDANQLTRLANPWVYTHSVKCLIGVHLLGGADAALWAASCMPSSLVTTLEEAAAPVSGDCCQVVSLLDLRPIATQKQSI